MRTKAERQDAEPSSINADKTTGQAELADRAAFNDLRPGTVAHRQNKELASTGPRLDQHRRAESAVRRKTDGVATAPNRTGLPDQLKSGIESLSGISMDGVKVHYNSSQPAQLSAHAYAQGTSIHIAPGQEHHLPHEAWHLVQQAQGRVQPTMQMKNATRINDTESLELEADLMGKRASKTVPFCTVNGQIAAEKAGASLDHGSSRRHPVQRKFIGTYGSTMNLLSPENIGAKDNYYSVLWSELKGAKGDIKVEAGANSFIQESGTMQLNESMLVSLVNNLKEKSMTPQLKASLIASITHEMSHAHDWLIKERIVRTPLTAGVAEHTKDVIDTELRAWAREALSAYQLSPGRLDGEKQDLVDGWQNISKELLHDIADASKKNEVMKRLVNYLGRELKKTVNDNDEIIPEQAWVNDYKDWLGTRIETLRGAMKFS
jgi:hypothetical protein